MLKYKKQRELIRLNINDIEKFIIWYGYKNPKLHSQNENTFFFRTDDWVVKAIMTNEDITLEVAREDFYEYYPMDFYDFDFECRFTIEEIKKEIE